MRKISKFHFIAIIAFAAFVTGSVGSHAENVPSAAVTAKEISIFISLQGNDTWSGDNPDASGAPGTGPLATFTQAGRKLYALLATKPNKPITIYVRGGTYYLPEIINLIDRESGTEAAPVTYRPYPNETVILSGGKPITGFIPYKGQILKVDVSSQGLGGNYFRQLFFAGNRQPLARYPNFDPKNPATGGWAFADGTPINKDTVVPNENRTQFVAKLGDIHSWPHPEDGEVFVLPRFNWWNDILPIASVDSKSRLITLKSPASFGIRPGDRYFIRNLLEELDSPGEWYLDKATNMLYFWPPAPLAQNPVMAPALQFIFRLNAGVSYVHIQGFTMEMAQRNAVLLDRTSHCLVAGNTIRHIGDITHNAVEVVSGSANGIVGNDIYDVGASAIHLTGGDIPTLTAAGNYAENNYIHHTGTDYKQGVGVLVDGVGNRASHNLIHDTPRFGIRFSGNNHVIEYNHIRDTCLETEDTGAIYTDALDWLGPRGSIIRGNYIHDTFGLDFATGKPLTPYFSWGIYLDEYSTDVTVDGNIVVGSYNAGIHVLNGTFNQIKNNILADNREAQISFAGHKKDSTGWTHLLDGMSKNYNLVAQAPAWNTRPGGRIDPQNAGLPDGSLMQGNKFEHNILYNRSNPESLLYKLYTCTVAYNVWDHNLVYNFNHPVWADNSKEDWEGKSKESFSAWQKRTGMDKNSLIADPQFVDPDHGNYDLKATSPALKLGITTTPMKNIGPYQDPLRASWPIVEAQGVRERGNH